MDSILIPDYFCSLHSDSEFPLVALKSIQRLCQRDQALDNDIPWNDCLALFESPVIMFCLSVIRLQSLVTVSVPGL